ncbi:hypothetical protein FNV43_RR05945 [Rhamnella rubrinervis]|uniref:Uncharacterized protein n=1 Tax=Rhamnella rubrinervis TaxID=2594499 RepID=A0A8K0HC55_9ROSA|nr:hypothetical protein FNV43_RR05945 [Rhamnella rubrinervis]
MELGGVSEIFIPYSRHMRDEGREAKPTIPRRARGHLKSRVALASMEATMAKAEGRASGGASWQHAKLSWAKFEAWLQENVAFQAKVLESLLLMQAQMDELKHGVEETCADWALCKRVTTSGAITTLHMVSTPRVDIPKPKEFSGKRDAKELDNFIWHMERYFKGLNMHDEKQKVTTTSLYFTDLGATWWHREHEPNASNSQNEQGAPSLQLHGWATTVGISKALTRGVQNIATVLTTAETLEDYRRGESSNPKPRDDHDDGEEIKAPQGKNNLRKPS